MAEMSLWPVPVGIDLSHPYVPSYPQSNLRLETRAYGSTLPVWRKSKACVNMDIHLLSRGRAGIPSGKRRLASHGSPGFPSFPTVSRLCRGGGRKQTALNSTRSQNKDEDLEDSTSKVKKTGCLLQRKIINYKVPKMFIINVS